MEGISHLEVPISHTVILRVIYGICINMFLHVGREHWYDLINIAHKSKRILMKSDK